MSRNYEQVLKQIESLKAEAERLRSKELDGVVSRIRDAIDHYGLTAADLGLSERGTRGAGKAAKPGKAAGRKGGGASAKNPGEAKFRDEAGNTWVGRGKRPQWFRDALAAGKTPQDLAVNK